MTIFAAVYLLLSFQLYALALSAALPPSHTLSLLDDHASTLKPAFNISLSKPSNGLPDEDFYLHVPSSPVTVKFYHYGDELRDAIAVVDVLEAALNDAANHRSYKKIGTAKLQYSKRYINTIDVVLLPEREMIWQMWRWALLALDAFMAMWDNVWLSFDVEVEGYKGRVGTGYVFKNFNKA